MNIAELAIRKKVVTLFLVILIIAGGVFAYQSMGRLEDPEYTIKEALVITYYPGASATQVEQEVTEKIERAIQQLPQLKRVTSLSKANVSIVTVVIKDKYTKYDLPQVWDELRRKINDVQSQLPPGALKSTVEDDYSDVYGILLAVTGKGFSYKELEDYADFLKRELLLVPDVAKVNIDGIQRQQVYVEISRERMAQLGISMDEIYQTLREQNLISPAGSVRVGDEYIKIRPTGNFKNVEEIGDLLIRGKTGKDLIYLKDIAKIVRTYQTPPNRITRFNGQPAYVLGVSIVSGGNVVSMGKAIKARLKQLEPLSPLGMKVHVITFQSDKVTQAIDGFIISLIEALIIVLVVLMLFMGFRSGIIIGLSLLITVLGSFIFMKLWGINLERISLGALIIALGMLVDNAIVINEGLLIRINRGMDKIKAAKEVVNQNAVPLLGATIIAILAFAAIGLSQDNTGEYTRSLFQVILISLLLSWLVGVTVTPLLCTMMLKPQNAASQSQSDPYQGFIFIFYKNFLNLCLRFRYITVGVLLALLASAIYAFGLLEESFFPESTTPQILVHYWMPEGTDIRRTSTDMKKLEKFIQQQPGVDSVASFIGSGAPRFVLTYSPEKAYTSYGVMLVNIDDYRNIDKVVPKIQNYADNNFIDAQTKIRKIILGPGKEDTIEVRFSGPNKSVLRRLANEAKSIMTADGGAVAIKDDWRERTKIIKPVLAESQAKNAGITKAQVDDAIQMTFSGKAVGVYRESDKLLPILSIAPPSERMDVDNIKNVQIWSPAANKMIPLRQVINNFTTTWEDAIVQRRNRIRTITAKATQKSGNASVVLARIKPKIDAIALPPGYTREWGGEYEDSQDAQKALFKNIPVTIVLMSLILVMLFNAVRQPLIIILTVPLAIIGVSFGLLATGQSFGFMALLGFLSLSGMLIKNSIVLIDEIDMEIAKGTEKYQAILAASISRLRPVAMAAVTTVLGMIPLLFDAFFIAMAVTIMAGLTFATILTLIFVPVLYSIMFRIKQQVGSS
ncbi:MAG: efflux RND transporter permease subunit [Pseudomonadota bacterium]